MAERLGFFSAAMVRLAGWYKETGLTRDGRVYYDRFIQKVIDGEKQSLADQIYVLLGYKLNYHSEDSLTQLVNGGLIAGNYFNQGPMGGFWHALMISAAVQEGTGKEVRWVQSSGHPLMSVVHHSIAESINGILVNVPGSAGRGFFEIMHALRRGEIVAFYPEGRSGRKIRPAVRGSERVILGTAHRGLEIVTASSWQDGRILNVSFQSHTPEQILNSPDCREYIMTAIASDLPQAA